MESSRIRKDDAITFDRAANKRRLEKYERARREHYGASLPVVNLRVEERLRQQAEEAATGYVAFLLRLALTRAVERNTSPA